jgi:hypothetical protein
MAYDEEQQKRSRVVVETPTARREEYSVRTTRVPERSGYSTGMIAVVALVAIAATALIMFLLMNRGDATNTNVNVTTAAATPIPTVPTPYPTPPPAVVMPPVQQAPPIIVQQPPPTTTQPVIVAPPAPTTSAPAPPDDATIEAKVSKALTDDPDVGAANITVTVINGSATLIGSVKTPDLKARAERLAHAIKGVKSVDNKIMVDTP